MKKALCLLNAVLFIVSFSLAGCAEPTDTWDFSPGSNTSFLEALFPDQPAWDNVFVVSSSNPLCNGKEVLSRNKFILAAAQYPEFCGSSDMATNLHEIAAFFANVSIETNGAAEGQYDGGLCYVKEVACSKYTNPECPALCQSYCNDLIEPWKNAPHCPCGYYGRGALQITNPYNYYETSMEVFGDDRLYQNPDMILEGSTAWQTSLAFWMIHDGGLAESVTTIQGTTTCHNAIHENLDFGKTIEVINGNLECQNPGADYIKKTQARIAYYSHYVELFSEALGMEETPTEHVQCAGDTPPDPDAEKKIRCGVNWTTANATCGTFCKSDEDCEDGENCYADLSPDPCD